MSTMQSAFKGYIMVTLSKDGNQKTIVQAFQSFQSVQAFH